ncbi:MAG: PAS domain-containing protein, partial [Pontiellaceae bacterium]|nr:PAS domain-containing protein [Pontiellaceae bacterium]
MIDFSASLFFGGAAPSGVAVFPLACEGVAWKSGLLWVSVMGMVLFWAVFHMKRNARIRRGDCDCEQLRTRVSTVLKYSRDVLFGFDLRTGTFDYLSPSCLSLTGYTADEMTAMGPQEFLKRLHPEDESKIQKLIVQLSRNGKDCEWFGAVDYRFLHHDGEYRSFNDHLHVVYGKDGKAAFLYGSIRDMTASTQLEESMRALEKKFHDSQKMAGLGLLASEVAHDFNNLMTVILGNTELSLLEYDGSDGGVLDEIKRTTLRAAELANQMLIYAGKTSLEVGSV